MEINLFENLILEDFYDLNNVYLVYFNNKYKKFVKSNNIFNDDTYYQKYKLDNQIKLYDYNKKKKINFGWIHGEHYEENAKNEENENIIPIVFGNIFISLKLKNNPFINYKTLIENYNGKFLDDLHITLGKYELSYKNKDHLKVFFNNIKTNENIIKNDLIKFILNNQKNGFQILGKDVPYNLRQQIFNSSNIKKFIFNYHVKKKCYLTKLISVGDMTNIFKYFHSNNSNLKFDYKQFYNEEDYKNYNIHISIGEFNDTEEALLALNHIIENNIIENYENNENNLNVISLTNLILKLKLIPFLFFIYTKFNNENYHIFNNSELSYKINFI